jgi:hypothetical protein
MPGIPTAGAFGYPPTSDELWDSSSHAQLITPPVTVPTGASIRHNYVDILFGGQAGHPFTFAGTGATGNNNDTTDYVVGTRSVWVQSPGNGVQSKISGTFAAALNLTGKYLAIWYKIVGEANILGGYPRLYLGDAALTNAYWWKLTESSGQPWALDGEWHQATLPFGTSTIVGAPSRASLAALTIQNYDNSAGTVKLMLGGLMTVNEPTTKWPNGVISLSFDDGYMSQFNNARPYLDKYGYRATAFVITETLWNHSQYTQYYDLPTAQSLEFESNWEISTHAYTAANHNAGYVAIGDEAALDDASLAKGYLQNNGFKSSSLFAYPQGLFSAGTIVNTRTLFIAGRSISYFGGLPDETIMPADLSRLRSLPCGNATTVVSIEQAIDRAFANAEWLILVFHDIVTTANTGLQFSIANFQTIIDYINTKGIPLRLISEVLQSGVSLI